MDLKKFISTFCLLSLWSVPVMGQTVTNENDGAALCAAGKLLSVDRMTGPVTDGFGKMGSFASPEFDAKHYHLDLDVNPGRDPVLRGFVTIRGKATSPLNVLKLDLAQTMTVVSVTADNNIALAFTHSNKVVSIQLLAQAQAGETIEVTIEYAGNPSGGGFGTFVWGNHLNGDPYLWTLSEPYGAKEWWPNKDHPSDKADSVRVTVRTPADLRVGSNGLLRSEVSNGDGTVTYDWVHAYPISSYLVSLAVGRYVVHEQVYERPDSLASQFGPLSLPILHYVYRGSNHYEGTGTSSGWKRILEVLPVFEHWFGPYPFPEEKYGHAHVTFEGGMEHQTMTSLGKSGLGLVAHELAHMWFGDLITNKTWPHLWLHEGFATMSELLFWESNIDRFPTTYQSIFDLYYARALTATGTLVVEDTTSVSNLFRHSRVYSKGAMVLHMLRSMVGDESYREILRTFSSDASVRYATAESKDFQRVAEEVSGLNLATFFEEWVTRGTGHPSYEVDWMASSSGSDHSVLIEIKQTQGFEDSNVDAFHMPIELVIHTEAGEQRIVVENSERNQVYMLPVNAAVTSVEFDPERRILREPFVPVTMMDLPTQFDVTVYPNPASDEINLQIDFPFPAPVTVKLIDTAGRLVATFHRESTYPGTFVRTIRIPPGTASGMYALEISSGDSVARRLVTIVR